MELAHKIREAINSGSEVKIRAVYFEAFGKTIRKDCGNCYNEAVGRLIKFTKKQTMQGAYKVKEKGKKIYLKVGGVRHLIDESNLTDSNAQLLIDNGRGHLIEKVGEVKVKLVEKKSGEPTLSILTEAATDLKESQENVSEKESSSNESEELTVESSPKKRGRPKANSK